MKTIVSLLLFSTAIWLTAGCTNGQENNEANPPAEGFNQEASDPEAIAIADNVMRALGGRQSWDRLRYVKWNFGNRQLFWDKHSGNVRIHIPADSAVFLVNVREDTGTVFVKGKEITRADSLRPMIEKAKRIWINDSYWLFMPFKLKDSGVTLKHVRSDTLPSGNQAYVLQLTFDSVGVTPQNKYEVYVDKTDNLVKQWAYFANSSQEKPNAVWPWDNYHDLAGLKISYNRSDNRGPKDVVLYSEVPEDVFTSPESPDWNAFPQVR